jgi:thymidylate synthase
MMKSARNATHAWRQAIFDAYHDGSDVAPRGIKVKEVINATTTVDMSCPVVTDKLRRLNYRFMFAEAAWILSGRNDVGYLTRYNSRMAEFSDDGVVLAGAYGVPFNYQLDYVVNKLRDDRDTRQATLTLWGRAPKPSRDIPCTVALDFKIRDDKLITQVFMRSSDVWLGLPYDIFAFTMMSYRVLERLHDFGAPPVDPGVLIITAASSHLYDTNAADAYKVLADFDQQNFTGKAWAPAPGAMYDQTARRPGHPPSLLAWLETLKDAPKDRRWWHQEEEPSDAPISG